MDGQQRSSRSRADRRLCQSESAKSLPADSTRLRFQCPHADRIQDNGTRIAIRFGSAEKRDALRRAMTSSQMIGDPHARERIERREVSEG
jgi:hypothetical protein